MELLELFVYLYCTCTDEEVCSELQIIMRYVILLAQVQCTFAK
jgi:hypothetical protein